MAGLLDKLGSAFNNPFVQGMAGTAAFGFNPLIGLLAGPALGAAQKRGAAHEQLTELLKSTSNTQGSSRIARSELDGSALGTIPGHRQQVPTAQTPQGQAQMLGLLSQAIPEQFAQIATAGLMGPRGQQRAAPSDIRTMQSLGIPLTEEGFATYQELKAKGDTGSGLEALLAQSLVDQRQSTIDAQRDALAQEQADRQKGFKTREQGLNSSLAGLEKLAGYNDALEDTFMRSGAFAGGRETAFETFEGIKSFLGGDTTEERELLTNVDLFKKGASNLLLKLIPKLQGINARTDNRLEQIKSSIADLGTQPGANREIMADIIDEFLSIGTIEGFEIESRENYLDLSKRLREKPKKTSGPTRYRYNPDTLQLEPMK